MEAKRRLAESLKQPWIPPHCRHVACKYATKASVTKYGTHHTRQFASKVYTPVRNASKLSPGKYLSRFCTLKIGIHACIDINMH